MPIHQKYALNVRNPWDAPKTSPSIPAVAPGRQLILPIDEPWPTNIDELNYQTYPSPPTMEPRVAGLGGLGAEGPLDITGMLRDMYDTFDQVKPTVDFFGAHPMLTLTLIIGAIIAGGAVGGYIGAGYKSSK